MLRETYPIPKTENMLAQIKEYMQVLSQIGLQFGILTTEIRPRLWFANHIYHNLRKILF